jgi:hypothetical protein
VTGIEDERTAEAGKLSMWVVGISNALVDLEMLSIWYIPQLSKVAREVLVAAGLILECQQEEHASSADPCD